MRTTSLKKYMAGQMAQESRILAALAENPSLVSSTSSSSQSAVILDPGDLVPKGTQACAYIHIHPIGK